MGGEASEETMRAYAAAQQRLEAGGGYRWRDDVLAVLRGLGFDARAGRAPARDLLRRRADPRLAGPRPRHPPRPAAPRRADEPSRHPLAGVARALPGRPRRRRRPRRPRPLVPGGGRDLGAGAGGAARPLLRRPLARLAPGAGGAADRPRQSDRAPAGGDRADGALRRALPLQGDEGAPGAVAGETDREKEARRAARRKARHPQPALPLQAAGAARAGGAETGQRHARGAGAGAARRRQPRNRARGTRRPGRPQRRRQDDPDRDPRRASASRRAAASAPATTSSSATSPSTPRPPPAAAACSTPPSARPASTRSRRAPCSAASSSPARDVEKQLSDISGGEQRRLSLAILVASGANVLVLDEPTNHLDIESREALEDALTEFEGTVLLVSHDRALLEAVGSRTLVCEDGKLQSYPSGWAEYQRRRDEEETEATAAAKPSVVRRQEVQRHQAGAESGAQGGEAGAADREGRGGAAGAGGRARRSRRLVEPRPGRAGDASATPRRRPRSKSSTRSGRQRSRTAEAGSTA